TPTLVALVGTAKLRWRIERDYQELKQELGLAHFEGRGWRGFHHHATLCVAAYGFLVRERGLFPPGARLRGQAPAPPGGWRPRGRPAPAGAPGACPPPRWAAARASRSGRSALTRSRSPRCGAVSRSPWLVVYPAVHAVS